jgi:hypothetical protein
VPATDELIMADSAPPGEPPEDGGEDDGRDEGPGDEDYSGEWVTLATFWTAPEAHLARLKLEAEDIPCVILDENLVATDWFLANATGGIKIKVPIEDAAAGAALLGRSADCGDGGVGACEPRAGDHPVCRRCGSSDVYRESWWRPMSLALLFAAVASLGVVLLIALPWIANRRRPWKCLNCGNEWEVGLGFPIAPTAGAGEDVAVKEH